MQKAYKMKSLCAWCGDSIINENEFVHKHKDRTIVNIRDNIVILCSQDHAKLYIQLPPLKCHFISPHNCKLVPPNIAITPVECDCPAKHLFCSQEIKDCFINDTLQKDSELNELEEIPVDTIEAIQASQQNKVLGDKKKRCKTCFCGYIHECFKYCSSCGDMRCSICHALDRCITCSTETYTDLGIRYSGLRYIGSYVMTQRNPNKNTKMCPQCHSVASTISYLVSECGHMCCSVCYSNQIKKCNICKNKIEAIDRVFLRYWSSRDYKPDIVIKEDKKFVEI